MSLARIRTCRCCAFSTGARHWRPCGVSDSGIAEYSFKQRPRVNLILRKNLFPKPQALNHKGPKLRFFHLPDAAQGVRSTKVLGLEAAQFSSGSCLWALVTVDAQQRQKQQHQEHSWQRGVERYTTAQKELDEADEDT